MKYLVRCEISIFMLIFAAELVVTRLRWPARERERVMQHLHEGTAMDGKHLNRNNDLSLF
jgi:hypothetical protein